MGSFPETSQVFSIQTELKASQRAGSSISPDCNFAQLIIIKSNIKLILGVT